MCSSQGIARALLAEICLEDLTPFSFAHQSKKMSGSFSEGTSNSCDSLKFFLRIECDLNRDLCLLELVNFLQLSTLSGSFKYLN